MRGLLVAVVAMGVLIVAGTAVLGVLIVRRLGEAGSAAPFSVVLEEPAGTRIAGVAGWPDHLAVTLTGVGADRVVVVDPRSGRVLGRVAVGARR
jgi:voltage-gated potassium channel Kch